MHLRADFNAVRDGNLITASLRFAVPVHGIELPEVGTPIRVEDFEGNSCWGIVETTEPPLIRVRLDWSTWKSADMLRLSDPVRLTGAFTGRFVEHSTRSRKAVITSGIRFVRTQTISNRSR